MVTGSLAADVVTVSAQPDAALSIQKVADASSVTPGQAFTYTIQVQCTTAVATGCIDATLTDPLPDFISLNGPVNVTGAANAPTVDTGPPISVAFQDDLGDGQIGLVAGTVVTITLPVIVDTTIPVEQDGQPIDNTAAITAGNADPRESTATVVPSVTATIAAGASKTFTPANQIAGSPDPVTLTLTGENTSNVPVDAMVIQDPIDDPPTGGGAFAALAATGTIDVTLPEGADTVVVEVYDSSIPGWVDGPVGPPAAFPAAVDPDDVTGIRLTFTDTDDSGIPPGATATVEVVLEQRDSLPDPLPADGAFDNDVRVTVERGDDSATADDDDTFRVRESEIAVVAGKSFDPDVIRAGDTTTVTLTGLNATPADAIEPLASMTITEPAPGTTNHFTTPAAITFAGFTDGVVWPTGADEATIVYECDGAAQTPQVTTTANTLPDPPEPCDVTGFSVTFTSPAGGIAAGATATLPFTVVTPEVQPSDEFERTNVVQVAGADASDNTDTAVADDTLLTIVDRLAVETEKRVVPATIPGFPGQIVVVALQGALLPFPESTVDADTIIVQDPSPLPDPNEWFDAFAPQAVSATPVPSCASLTVQYTTDDGSSWVDVPDLTDIPGPTIVNAPLPSEVRNDADGIRFVYVAAPAGNGCQGGFPPSTTVAPNLSFGVRPGGPADEPDDDVTFTDCAATSATAPTVPEVVSPDACDEVTVEPLPLLGEIDPIDKTWDDDVINARSQTEAGATISWSTSGFSGLAGVRVSDIPDPFGTDLDDSVFDTFDLVGIAPITPADDPQLVYDQVFATELFVVTDPTDPTTGEWVVADGDPCPDACDGTYPGYTVPSELRETTIGFRLTYIESPTRGTRLNVAAPPVGTGVAPSTGNDRTIRPVFELRDELRSDADVPVTASRTYNTGADGVIRNDVMIETVFDFDDEPFEWFDSDTIALADVPVTVNSTKSWTGGPLGIPQTDVPQSDYPTGRVTLTGTNTTPALIDRLVLVDDTAGDTFEWFDLVDITTITPPGDVGADDVTITLAGLTPSDYTRSEALGLGPGDLVDATGITVTYTGRINGQTEPDVAVDATATVEFDTRLRAAGRTSGEPPTTAVSPVDNQVTVEGADLVGYPDVDPVTGTSTADASMTLTEQGIFVTASKTFSPGSQVEPDDSPVTVTIGGRPHAPDGVTTPPPSRAVEMVLVDDDPRLWNQYDMVALDDVTFTTPIDRVRVDALTDGTWGLDGGGDPVVTGATWQVGEVTAGPALALPAGVDPAEVQGLRFTFTRADGANWENPANPLQSASFQVQRRANLQVGPGGELDSVPVPPGLAIFDPAPGETEPGEATNTSTAQATSSDLGPGGQPLVSEIDEATDTIVFESATNSVSVAKSPEGSTIPPGPPFTYTLTFTNDGDIEITDPVITDRLPVDGDGPMLELADPTDFTFTIDGGTGMPTDAPDVTITDDSADADAPTLTFEFPPGSELPIGAIYTITFDATLRPGLPAATEFTNDVGIVAQRPFDACNGAAADGDNDSFDPDTGECRAEATNTVALAGAISVRKLVQAEDSDVLGVITDPAVGTADPAECIADADGFHDRPCVPVAQPGGDVTWRLRFVNTGNRGIDRVLGIDTLPAPGDTLATAPVLARGSEWRPLLTGERPTLVDADLGELVVWFVTGASTCNAVAPAVGDDGLLCPDLDWVEWPAGSTLADLSVDPDDVTGIQVEILPDEPLAPAGIADVDVAMTAPAFLPDADLTAPETQPDVIAFNTVGTTGRIVDVEDDPVSYTLPTEPPRVGVGLASGPLAVQKLLTGTAASWAPTSFDVTLTCTSAGEDVPIPTEIAERTLVPGEPETIHNLPWGAVCSLAEGTAAGQTSSTSTPATVDRVGTTVAVASITNVYDDAPLTIAKVVDSDAVDHSGTPISYGPFEVTVDCTFLDQPVYADGFGPDAPMALALGGGGEIRLTGIPVGARCVISETDSKGAVSTSIAVVPAEAVASADDTEATVDLPVGETTATFTNAFNVGSVRIDKAITGDADAPGAAGPFTVAMTCALDDESGQRTVWDGSVVLGGSEPFTRTIDDLATGARCTFVETDPNGATEVSIEPAGGVTVGDGTTASVTVTNTFPPSPTQPPPPPEPAPPTAPPSGELPITGSTLDRLLRAALLLFLGGVAVVVSSRRRRTQLTRPGTPAGATPDR